MTSKTLKFGILTAIVLGSLAAPLIVLSRTQTRLRQGAEGLWVQAQKLAALEADNARLETLSHESNSTPPLSAEETSELLRVRSEIGMLRQQTNLMAKLREENAWLLAQAAAPPRPDTPKSEAELVEELSADTIACMKNIVAELPSALQRFGEDHPNKLPTDFWELRDYFRAHGRPMTGIYTFEFVRSDGPRPGDFLLLRETAPRDKEGKKVRVYGFRDGTAVEMAFQDDYQLGRSELTWERQQLGLPPPVFKEGN